MSSLLKQLLRLPEVRTVTKQSKSAIYEGILEQTFPGPIKHGRSSYWVAEEIAAWIESRIAERDAKIQAKQNLTSSTPESSPVPIDRKRSTMRRRRSKSAEESTATSDTLEF